MTDGTAVIFQDRVDAGQRLASLLHRFQDEPRTLVLGIPRGGVVVANAIARELHLPLGVCPVRKVGAPDNPELALGAVDDDQVLVFDRRLMRHLGVEEDFRPARKAHPGLLVEGLDAWAARLREAGYPVAYDDDFPGMRRFYSQDPHGNRLEFLEPLSAH